MRVVSRFVRCGLIGGSFVALACALGTGAQAQVTLGPLVQITVGDPFASCTADNVGQQQAAFDSILYPNTAIEPWVAVDPSNANRLLVGHQQDRWNNGGSRGLVGNVSADGGSTWSNTIPGGVVRCAGGKRDRSSDPWVTFATDGTAFFFHLAIDPAQPTTPFGARNSAVLVSRSTDHGQTWGDPTTLLENKTPHVLNDKNSITADLTAAGHVYAVWDQLSVFPAQGHDADAAAVAGSNDGVDIARNIVGLLRAAGGAPSTKFNFTGPTFFATTADNGNNWGAARAIFDPGTNAQTIDNLVVVPPSGAVYDFFTGINLTPAILNIAYIRSTDKGANWSGPTFATDIQVVGVVTPDTGGPIRDASILYAVTADPNSGALYLAWQDDRFSSATCTTPTGSIPIDGVVFSQSLDGGLTWSSPVQINKTPANAANPCRQQAFIPAVVAAGDGTIVVTYYDFRNDTGMGGVEATDYFALFCRPADGPCTNPANWGNEQRLTTNSFNILDAPIARGHFLGDYMGLTASGKTVWPVFGIATATNQTADFTRKITLPAAGL
jgi:hypothetical protein